MTNQEILNKVAEARKGTYIAIRKRKDIGKNTGIEKISDLVIRLGVNFANMKINEGRETGALPWGKWVEGYEGLVIEHKGNYYLRVASSYANNGKSFYLKDGEEIDKNSVIEIVGEKALQGKAADVYNIKFENIISIGSGN